MLYAIYLKHSKPFYTLFIHQSTSIQKENLLQLDSFVETTT